MTIVSIMVAAIVVVLSSVVSTSGVDDVCSGGIIFLLSWGNWSSHI